MVNICASWVDGSKATFLVQVLGFDGTHWLEADA